MEKEFSATLLFVVIVFFLFSLLPKNERGSYKFLMTGHGHSGIVWMDRTCFVCISGKDKARVTEAGRADPPSRKWQKAEKPADSVGAAPESSAESDRAD